MSLVRERGPEYMKRAALAFSSLLCLHAAVAAAAESAYPARPIRLIIPYPPGGGADTFGRLIAQRLSDQFGQQVVVDNRGGANGIIGTDLAAKAAPDGYTMALILPANVSVNPSLYRNLPYDTERDFAPVVQLNSIALLLVAHPSLPAKNMAELLQVARAKPGQLNYASSGTGSSSHLAMELVKSMAKVDLMHVPYKGGAPALNDVLGGQVQMYFGPAVTSFALIKAGRVKGLGVTTAKRVPSLPDVPAIGETIPGYESSSWQGIIVPKKTPAAIVDRLNAEINKVLQQPDVREKLTADGAEVVGGTPAQIGALIRQETAKYAKLIKERGIRAE